MEPADPGVMRRRPRDPRQRLFTRRLVLRSLLQGGGATAVSLAIYLSALRSGYGELDIRSLTFSTLIVVNLTLIFASRSLRPAPFDGWRMGNPALWSLSGGALAVLAAVLFVPPLRNAFRLASPHADDLAIVVVAGILSVAWMELVKRALRERESGNP